MDPDRLNQLTQEELDAWAAESCPPDDDGFDDDLDDEGQLDAQWARLAARAGGERALLLTEIADTEAWQRMLQARQQQQLATLSRLSPFADDPPPPGAEALDDDRHAVHAAALEVSVLLGIAPSTAKGRLHAARELVEQHPDLHTALAAGLLDGWRTRLILDALRPLPADTARQVQAQILADAAGLTAAKLQQRLRRLVMAADPRDAATRHAQARAGRRVATRPGADGMGQLFGELPAEDLAVVDQILDRVADALRDTDPTDTRTKAQRRADALARICRDVARTGHTGGCQPNCGHHPATSDDVRDDTGQGNDANAAAPPADTDDARDNDNDNQRGDDDERDAEGRADDVDNSREGDVNQRGDDERDVDNPREGDGDRRGAADARDDDERDDEGRADDERSDDNPRGGRDDSPGAGAGRLFRRGVDPAGCPEEPPVLLRVRDRVGRPHIQVTVSWTTLAGLDDLPAQLAGYGPITADQARALAADGVWRRLLTDPATGVLLDYGRDVYRPPQALQEFVRGRDVTSTFPTDSTPAHRAEIDHAQPWHDGGVTSAGNCHALSGWINRAKTWYGWHALPLPDGTLRWTSPTGIVTDRPATRIGPTDTEQAEAAARKRHHKPDPPPF